MSLYSVGDRVQLVNVESEWPDGLVNPVQHLPGACHGTVIDVDGHHYRVEWDNGFKNGSYIAHHLSPIPAPDKPVSEADLDALDKAEPVSEPAPELIPSLGELESLDDLVWGKVYVYDPFDCPEQVVCICSIKGRCKFAYTGGDILRLTEEEIVKPPEPEYKLPEVGSIIRIDGAIDFSGLATKPLDILGVYEVNRVESEGVKYPAITATNLVTGETTYIMKPTYTVIR